MANTEPKTHPLYDSPILSLANSVVSAEDIASPKFLQKLALLEQNKAFVEKTALDFSFALEQCLLSSNASHIALFEGDIVAAEGWFARMQMALREVYKISAQREQEWLDLRLFNDAKELGWAAHKIGHSRIPLLVITLPLIILALSGTTFLLLERLRSTKNGSKMVSLQATQTICLVSIPIFVILYIRTGYLSTQPRPVGVSIQRWGCCTQGEIFPRHQVPELIAQLRERATGSPADITVWDHAGENNLLRLVLDPPMVQHVGFSSILTPNRTMKRAIWNMDFEDLDAVELRSMHREMVTELYGNREERA
jgi:hypothetical protein